MIFVNREHVGVIEWDYDGVMCVCAIDNCRALDFVAEEWEWWEDRFQVEKRRQR